MEEEVIPYLVKTCLHDGVTITCDEWNRLFRIQEPVYQELCEDFFSTINFYGGDDHYNLGVLMFFLGREYRQCSMVELPWRLGIYDQHVVNLGAFGTFLGACHKGFSEGMSGASWWNNIASKVYIPKSTQEGRICSPIHRLLHRLVSSTINMGKDDDKVPNLDLLFLWSVLTPGVFLQHTLLFSKVLGGKGCKG